MRILVRITEAVHGCWMSWIWEHKLPRYSLCRYLGYSTGDVVFSHKEAEGGRDDEEIELGESSIHNSFQYIQASSR